MILKNNAISLKHKNHRVLEDSPCHSVKYFPNSAYVFTCFYFISGFN